MGNRGGETKGREGEGREGRGCWREEVEGCWRVCQIKGRPVRPQAVSEPQGCDWQWRVRGGGTTISLIILTIIKIIVCKQL